MNLWRLSIVKVYLHFFNKLKVQVDAIEGLTHTCLWICLRFVAFFKTNFKDSVCVTYIVIWQPNRRGKINLKTQSKIATAVQQNIPIFDQEWSKKKGKLT